MNIEHRRSIFSLFRIGGVSYEVSGKKTEALKPDFGISILDTACYTPYFRWQKTNIKQDKGVH